MNDKKGNISTCIQKKKNYIFLVLSCLIVSILKKQLCSVFGEKQTSPALLGSKEV
jgi:hypothetical protein